MSEEREAEISRKPKGLFFLEFPLSRIRGTSAKKEKQALGRPQTSTENFDRRTPFDKQENTKYFPSNSVELNTIHPQGAVSEKERDL